MGTAPNGLYIPPARELASGLLQHASGQLIALTVAAVKAIASDLRYKGMEVLVLENRSRWFFDPDLAVSDVTNNVLLTPDGGSGRWVRADHAFVAKMPIDFSLADGATIFTVPEGFVLRPTGLPYWEITTAFSGGASSAIGIASSRTGFTAAGAVLGGASGDVAAGLGAGTKAGTIGTGFDTVAEQHAGLFVEGDTFTFERITSVFTAGAGFLCLPVALANGPLTP